MKAIAIITILVLSSLVFAQDRPGIGDPFALVAQRVPEFGGLFLSDNATILNIYLTDVTKKSEAESAIKEVFGDDFLAGKEIKVLQGQYGWLQLRQWYDAMRPSLSRVVFTDIDESKNRIRIGIESMNHRSAVEQELTRLDIPLEAVNIELSEPIVSQKESINQNWIFAAIVILIVIIGTLIYYKRK